MSAVNEAIAREYFESLGYLVGQPCKYTVPGRHKQAEEELEMLISHPLILQHRVPSHIVWTGEDLRGIARAIVGVRGWHTKRFSVAKLVGAPELLRFAEPAARHAAAGRLGGTEMAAILCLSDLPASVELKEKTLHALKEHGIDGVLSFRTMLLELLARVDVRRNYDKSDLLQTLRILKNYRLLRSPQLDLFERPRRMRRPRVAVAPAEEKR